MATPHILAYFDMADIAARWNWRSGSSFIACRFCDIEWIMYRPDRQGD